MAFTDQEWKTYLRAVLMEVDAVAAEVAVQSSFIKLRAILTGRINQIGGKINPIDYPPSHEALNDKLKSVISDLQTIPWLYNLLYALDKMGSGFLFNDSSHTISYNIAVAAKAGNLWAIEACKVLNLLSENHCAWSLANESLCRVV